MECLDQVQIDLPSRLGFGYIYKWNMKSALKWFFFWMLILCSFYCPPKIQLCPLGLLPLPTRVAVLVYYQSCSPLFCSDPNRCFRTHSQLPIWLIITFFSGLQSINPPSAPDPPSPKIVFEYHNSDAKGKDNVTYLFSSFGLPWAEADKFCRGRGGWLAEIESHKEKRKLRQYWRKYEKRSLKDTIKAIYL